MERTTEYVVDILRRSGPGTLSVRRLRRELRRRRPAIVLTMEQLRLIVEESEDRLMLMEVTVDEPEEEAEAAPLDSWIVLMAPQDAPDGRGLARHLWQSLSALATETDPTSRISVSRWILKAERAWRLCAAGIPW